MELHTNPRRNGDCPLCNKNGSCRVTRKLINSVTDENNKDRLDIVIYRCPDFEETT